MYKRQDIPFNNCNIDGLEINVNSGRSYAGGFIGRCNHGMYVNLKTESGNAPVFENENNKKTVINNLIINKKNTTYTEDAVGGMIGYGSSLNIGNVTVENMNINAQNVKNIGGIVGVANEYNLNINNVKIGNSDTKEIKLDGGIDSAPGNQDINVGGIIGSYDREMCIRDRSCVTDSHRWCIRCIESNTLSIKVNRLCSIVYLI